MPPTTTTLPPPLRRRRALILYISQTSTSTDLAAQLCTLLARLHIPCTLLPANAFPLSSLPTYDLAFFIVSTTGDGEVPDNGKLFWRKLCARRIPGNWLKNEREGTGTHFAVFGVGDSAYSKFCWAARMVGRRLKGVGGAPVGEEEDGVVCADQAKEGGVEVVWEWWMGWVREMLLRDWGLPEGVEEIRRDVLVPVRWWVEAATDGATNGKTNGEHTNGTSDSAASWKTTHAPRLSSQLSHLTSSTRLTPESHLQNTLHLTFTLPSPQTWDPGDTLALLPKNSPADVTAFLKLQPHLLPLAYVPLAIRSAPDIPPEDLPPNPLPEPVWPLTLRNLLIHHLDITAIPRRSFFETAACLCTDSYQQERLREFTDVKFVEELWDYTTRPRRTMLEVLQEFGGVRIPLERLLETIPPIRERQFSIASCCLGQDLDEKREHGSRDVELLVAVVGYRTILKKPRVGLCTRWLKELDVGDEVQVRFCKGSLLGPASMENGRPAVLVGPGTGIAPLRALLWHRVHHGLQQDGVPDLLFPAHRYRERDYYFKEEWERLQGEGVKVFPVFSRDGEKGRRYVQGMIKEKREEVARAVVEQRGIVYVCGSSGNMPKAVKEAVVEVVEWWLREKGEGREEAEKWVQQMEVDGRWRMETWA